MEIRNSSAGVDPEWLKILNSETPQPIPSQRYDRATGKKRGGSGFGHYYARRSIAEFCGGRSDRRKLDVQLAELPDGTVLVRVNLLEAVNPKLKLVTAQAFLDGTRGAVGSQGPALLGEP